MPQTTTQAVLKVGGKLASFSEFTDITITVDEFLVSLFEKGAHRAAYVFMDASTETWIYACNNVIGKDGPSDKLLKRMFQCANYRKLLQSPHLKPERCRYTNISILF